MTHELTEEDKKQAIDELNQTGWVAPSAIGVHGVIVGEGTTEEALVVISMIIDVGGMTIPQNYAFGEAAIEALRVRLNEVVPLTQQTNAQFKNKRN